MMVSSSRSNDLRGYRLNKGNHFVFAVARHEVFVDNYLRVRYGLGAAVQNVSQHHEVADDRAPLEQIRIWRQYPKTVAQRALDDARILHRFREPRDCRR